MSFFFSQLYRSILTFFRTLKAYFMRKTMTISTNLRRLTNFSRSATRVATSSIQGVMSAAQKPTERGDYVETGRLFISKALIIRILLGLVALGLIIYFVVWPFVLSRFLTARFYEEDKRVEDWSGKVIVYSDKKKTLPLFSGRLEDGVLQGECKEYDREGILLFEGQMKDGQRTGSGKEYAEGILVYQGGFENGLYTGRGKRYEDGSMVYDGQYDGGLRSGSGTAYADGEILYTGQFLEDMYEGRGKLYENGILVYEGGFAAGIPEGSGTAYRDGKVLYEGQFTAGAYEGQGKLYSLTAYEDYGGPDHYLDYDGDFHSGSPEGTGTFYYPDGNPRYKGDVQAGLPNGSGTFYYGSGRQVEYEGGVRDGRFDGQGIWYLRDGGTIEGSFQSGGPLGTVEWRKNGLLYYAGEWGKLEGEGDGQRFEGHASGFGTLYNKAGKVIYEGPFRNGTLDGQALLTYTTEKFKAALGEGSYTVEREGDGYRIIAPELGLTALCTFQTEEDESVVYQLYLAAPEDPDWVRILPGNDFTLLGARWWPEDAEPNRNDIIYIGQYGVGLDPGTYPAISVVWDDSRVTVLYSPENRGLALLTTWVRTDITPKALDLGDNGPQVEDVSDFLAALDGMEAAEGTEMGTGAVLGDADPQAVFADLEDADQAVNLADAMLGSWAQLEQMAALQEVAERNAVLLEKAKENAAKGTGSQAEVDALAQRQQELEGQLESCMTALKRAQLQAGELGAQGLENYALDDMVVDFDPSAQDVSELTLVAVAYAQATGSHMSPEAVETQVKMGLLDLTDAYGKVKQALARYQTAAAATKTAAGDFSMGLGDRETWYAAMNEETMARADMCSALSDFSRLANAFNRLTGGWVSRSFDWQREVFEPLFRAAILPEPEPELEPEPEEDAGEEAEEEADEEADPPGEGADGEAA